MAEAKTFSLKLTSAIALGGQIRTAGAIVDVDEATAKNLLHRGKALVATADDGQAEPEAPAGDEAATKAAADAAAADQAAKDAAAKEAADKAAADKAAKDAAKAATKAAAKK